MPTGHFGIDLLENTPGEAYAAARSLGINTIVLPWLNPEDRPNDIKGWQELAKRIARISKSVRSEGFDFCWHNHDFEFEALQATHLPMKILLDDAPEMNREADLGWIIRAGIDPDKWITSYGERIVAVHVKDRQAPTKPVVEDGWSDLGHGVTNWEPIYSALARAPHLKVHVAEHDNPAGLIRFLNRWKATFDRLQLGRPFSEAS